MATTGAKAQFGFATGDAIIVTGAGSGIGRATALRAAGMGLAVSAWDLNPASLSDTVAMITQAGGTVHSWVADVTDPQAVTEGISSARDALGELRYLHNNAGPPATAALSFDEAIIQCIGSVRRVTDTWASTLPGPGAAMVVTVSVAGNLIGTESDWYSASKAGLMGYVRHLAAQRAAEFRSNAVAPGMTDTPRLAGFTASETGQRVLAKNPLGRLASPDDIAYAVLFLMSPLASYINGILLPVDGGWSVTQ